VTSSAKVGRVAGSALQLIDASRAYTYKVSNGHPWRERERARGDEQELECWSTEKQRAVLECSRARGGPGSAGAVPLQRPSRFDARSGTPGTEGACARSP
jgi:hypothetical protein